MIFLFRLHKVKDRRPSEINDDVRDIYVFHSLGEYYEYFRTNGINLIDRELFDKAIFMNLSNGDVIVLKGLCDYIITRKTNEFPSNTR